MNPAPPPPQPPLPPPLQPHRPSTSCPRHPDENFTGFCPSCLCERLAVLDSSTSSSTSSARKPPTASAAAAIKAIFRPPSFPELRRSKSFSVSKNEAFSGVFEPQRRSCDVRVRSSLFNLFNHENSNNNNNERKTLNNEASRVVDVESKNQEFSSKEEEEEKVLEDEEDDGEDEIRVSEEPNNACNVTGEIVEEEEEIGVGFVEEEEELKTMKDHIDLDSSQTKKSKDLKEIAGSFWSAASVFSKKLQKWRQKQKEKKQRRNGTLPVEKPISRQFRDTQSEVADYGYGRRSCDVDPRFSLDAGRISFDDPRYSLEEPRASWDGYLIGRTSFSRMPTMLSVVEDSPVNHVVRTDTQIPVEEPLNEDDSLPGGSAQTREYYGDSSSRRRKSLDRSNSVKKSAVLEMDHESKSVSSGSIVNGNNDNANAKVTPAGVEYINGVKMGFHDRDLSSNSTRDDCGSEVFDMGITNGDRKGSKKSSRWGKAWSIWGLIHRRGGNKDEDEDRYSRVNGVDRSFSESWPELRGGDGRGGFNGRMLRSNSSVSWRNSQGIGGSFGSVRKNGIHGKKGKDEFVLERNRSARYSPKHFDNGLLRFYLTPLRGSRRNGSVKSRSNQAHSVARSVPGLY